LFPVKGGSIFEKPETGWFIPLKLASVTCWYARFHCLKATKRYGRKSEALGRAAHDPAVISGYCLLLYLVQC